MEFIYGSKDEKFDSKHNPVQVRISDKIPPRRNKSSFLTAIKTTIIIGQCFGLNPVLGVCEKDATKLRFKYISARFLYTFISILGQFVMACLLITRLLKNSFSTVDSGTDIIFYCLNLATTVLFLRIAMKWPQLCVEISEMEIVDPTADPKLKLKFIMSSCAILTLALLEHILSEIHGISLAIDCEPEMSIYQAFITRRCPWIFSELPYHVYIGIISHFINIQCTFNWNFTDVFVICMSTYLTSRLEQVNRRVEAAKNKDLPLSFWRTVREDYTKATNLVRKVDNIIGGIIFISFANNLFFICAQLLHTLQHGGTSGGRCRENDTSVDRRYNEIMIAIELMLPFNLSSVNRIFPLLYWYCVQLKVYYDTYIIYSRFFILVANVMSFIYAPLQGHEYSIYFAYSFLFLVARSLAVSLTASRVHLASLQPAFALYDVSSNAYCTEVERFINQIHGDNVALTGLQFFSVKRGLILTIASTIVTYELVLMQFTGVTPTTPPSL